MKILLDIQVLGKVLETLRMTVMKLARVFVAELMSLHHTNK
jgi:hypothetical protein